MPAIKNETLRAMANFVDFKIMKQKPDIHCRDANSDLCTQMIDPASLRVDGFQIKNMQIVGWFLTQLARNVS
jgi:hypothetical protein